ncbi:MAG: DUF2059 domain-containing protein [Rhizobiaceae bacterium]
MTISSGLRRSITMAAASLFLMSAGFAQAQEATPEHLAAARAAIAAIGATNQFDGILPQAAEALKGQMIQKDPNLEALITSTVDNEVLALAARRADLEQEAARVYAKVFTEAELKGIAEFYSTDIGKKLIAEGPIATRGIVDAANIWQAGVARDLSKNVGDKIRAAVPAEAPAAPAEGEKAPEAPKQ